MNRAWQIVSTTVREFNCCNRHHHHSTWPSVPAAAPAHPTSRTPHSWENYPLVQKYVLVLRPSAAPVLLTRSFNRLLEQ
jgi:hypothetical protein